MMMMGDKFRINIDVDQVTSRFFYGDYERVFFIANNPLITPEFFQGLDVRPSDVLVQFNNSLFFDILSGLKCHKVHVFNANGHASYWGFTQDGLPERDYPLQSYTELTLLFTFWMAQFVAGYESLLPAAALVGLINREWEPSHFAYPQPSKPSVGFQAVTYFKLLNSLRILQRTAPLALILVGFTGDYSPGAAWVSHDFAFEQRAYKIWLDVHTWPMRP